MHGALNLDSKTVNPKAYRTMEIQTRDRIVGGVFVIALAVIFVPMLFDEPRGPALEIEPMTDFELESVPPIPLPNTDRAIAKRDELRDLVDEDGYMVESGTRLGDVTLIQNPTESDAWAVQLASFIEEQHVVALRERLQRDGQPTWISETKVDGQLMTRVAVGPFLDADEAEAFRASISERYEIDAVVVGYQP
ncbi:MAG: hypothetical protein F4W90_07665 [Gammaproteobacteria bacterium]|nr:hypothetical protein [Gammaproteobacteria bacterium]